MTTDAAKPPTLPRERRFQLLVEAISDYGIFMMDPTGIVMSWNSGAQQITGYAADEIIGHHCSLFHSDAERLAGEPEKALDIAAREGRFETEAWRVRKGGARFWATVVINAMRDEAGTLIGFAEVMRDVTERLNADRALQDSEQRFRLLVQGVTDYAIYMVDPSGRITNWNSGAERIKGYLAQEIVGKNFSLFYTEEDRAAGIPAVALATALREGKYENEGFRVRKDGSRFWASVVIDPIRDRSGELMGFAKITRDITERRKATELLEQTQLALLQAQKMEAVGQLTGGIAHDFNNMLTVIMNSLDLLRRRTADPREVRLIDGAQLAADRGAKLTQQLLAFARRQPLQPSGCDVNMLIRGFEAVLRRACSETIQMEFALGRALDPVHIDAAQFEAALLNLVVNARDAMPGGGRLRIATEPAVGEPGRGLPAGMEAGRYIKVLVQDNGSGMSPAVVSRAFEPFFTTKQVGAGSGLGLSQVYGFVVQSGGNVEIVSTPGTGTTILIYLPVSLGAVENAGGRESAVGSAGTVLVVEDEPEVLTVAVEILHGLGFHVHTAGDGRSALEILRRGEPVDLLFTDVVMPNGLNGVELARAARTLRPDLPVLLASGYPMSAFTGREGGAHEFAFISKPYRSAELAEKIRSLR